MHIVVTGGTGFIGSALLPGLSGDGHQLTVLTRQARCDSGSIRFVTDISMVDTAIDAVINLAGASLADRRWSDSYKRELRASRIDTTRELGAALHAAGHDPAAFLSASAIGYYGTRKEQVTEDAPAGEGFAADLCRDWEDAARAAAGNARFCAMRLGVVFGPKGGAYGQMAMPFRLRVGNWIGSGEQGLSWIHLDDVVAAVRYLLGDSTLSGVVNLTAPEPSTSRGFCEAMQAVRPSLIKMPVPAFLMRALMGEMADELLIGGQQVLPRRLLEAGFTFFYPRLETALRNLEGREPN